ncbi:N-acetylglucosamine-6-phosphate deacetylase [Lentilactobacillus hilgardii]|uniref:N-acetylglucosamine-6-phosphate deacetylase n=1 Tax=Lentilactobacillus hilgardii TaxID=1588 RepID=UPI0021A45433|nr:N-acetylglucosamine-6-phosphate deacetylase [Lentilactobacillus hilgardii]MCT3396452.1 N-acetylglucosamine-6-phosphate deacetylase [Lentilactobacillus hilgardii]
MSKVLTNGHIYTGRREIKCGFIRFSDKVNAIGSMQDFHLQRDDDVNDLKGKLVVPGFIDVHVHGGYGIDSMTGDSSHISQMVSKMKSEGVTALLLTTMTQSPSKISHAMVAIREATLINPVIVGIHLEGPFVSKKFNGAQPIDQIQSVNVSDLSRWNQLSGGLVRLITYAPEVNDHRSLEAYCNAHQIRISVGHSDATYKTLQQCQVDHITHLFNAQRGLHQREPGVVGFSMLSDMPVELICDGYHVVSPVVKLAYRIIGSDRLELVTDAMEAKGMVDGDYQLGGQHVLVTKNRAILGNGKLAGSVLKFDQAFRNVIQFTGCSIGDAVKMSSTNQAKEFNLKGKGSLEIGSDADINVFDNQLDLMATYSYGK